MDQLVESLMEELNCNTVFTIPIFGGIQVFESVVVTWIIMAVLMGASLILTRHLKVRNISTRQAALESGFSFVYSFFSDLLGEEGKEYIPYLITVAVYIAIANMIGLLGFKSPTKDLNVTAGLALMSCGLIYGSSFKIKGLKGGLHKFIEPIPLLLPINLMEVIIRPLSLCMRLFGNVLGAFIIMELIKLAIPAILPMALSMYFDVFDGIIQTIVFVFLTALFTAETIE